MISKSERLSVFLPGSLGAIFYSWGASGWQRGWNARSQPQQNGHGSERETGRFLMSIEQAERRYVAGYCLTGRTEMQREGQNTES